MTPAVYRDSFVRWKSGWPCADGWWATPLAKDGHEAD